MKGVKGASKRRRWGSDPASATLGFEEHLWRAADALRGKVEPAEYKHVVLSMLFLHSIVELGSGKLQMPPGLRWHAFAPQADREGIGSLIDTLESMNPAYKNAIPRPPLSVADADLRALALQIDRMPLPGDRRVAQDLLGRVYEYFLAKFASAEGRSGGEYYTPKSIVRLLVEMLRPTKGIIYDPCCGTAGMFIQSEDFLEGHGGSASQLKVVGQESSLTTWRLARMNLLMHGIEADLGPRNADTFAEDVHPDLKADYIIANPPFNQKAWMHGSSGSDPRWVFGPPAVANANYAWIQHIFSHLGPNGAAGFVLSNGSLASDRGTDLAVRKTMLDRDVIECIVTLPSQLFYGTQIPACLWFISPNKTRDGARHIKNKTLFIDARSGGHLVDRVHAELSNEEIQRIADTYDRWRTRADFENEPGFAYSASVEDITQHKFALVPGRYVGFSPDETAFDAEEVRREMPDALDRLRAVAELSSTATNIIRSAT